MGSVLYVDCDYSMIQNGPKGQNTYIREHFSPIWRSGGSEVRKDIDQEQGVS